MDTVITGILGSRLDHGGLGSRQHQRWRPSISLLMHDNLPVDEFVLIYQQLATLTLNDMAAMSPQLPFRSRAAL